MHRLPVFEAVTAAAAEQQGGTLSEHPAPPYITNSQQQQQLQMMQQAQLALVPQTPPQQIIPAQPHAMPQPVMPWNLESMPWQIASNNTVGVMQFNAHADNEHQRRALLHQKRKPNSNELVPIPPKQFISEEKITAHFNGLHISSDHIQNSASTSSMLNNDESRLNELRTTGKCFTNLTYRDYQLTAKELEEKLLNATSITMCDEVKKLHEEEQRKLAFLPLPTPVSNPIENPSCNALVLWQPPPVLSALQEQLNKEKEQKLGTKNMNSDMTDDDNQFYDDMDNNNTFAVDFNAINGEDMDEDL